MVEMWRHHKKSRAKPGAIAKELIGARLDIQVMETIAKKPMTINDLSEVIYGNRYSQNLNARIKRLEEDGLVRTGKDGTIRLRDINETSPQEERALAKQKSINEFLMRNP
jgi:DNA-binding HxlR family transcriptional regulator